MGRETTRANDAEHRFGYLWQGLCLCVVCVWLVSVTTLGVFGQEFLRPSGSLTIDTHWPSRLRMRGHRHLVLAGLFGFVCMCTLRLCRSCLPLFSALMQGGLLYVCDRSDEPQTSSLVGGEINNAYE